MAAGPLDYGMRYNATASQPLEKTEKGMCIMTAISEVFWGEIAPCEHLVQIYEESGVFLDSLEGIRRGRAAGRRWRAGDCRAGES